MTCLNRTMMPSTCLIVILACIVLQRCTITSGSTHWIVTEDGKVQSQADSVFNLRRPYDLVAFLKQEDRATMLNDLKKELLSRKDEIDRNEDRDTGLEQKFYKTNPDCIEAGKRLPEFDLYISTVLPLENKGIRPEEHIDINAAPSSNPKAPDCTEFMDMDFSMHAFEHLEGMKARNNLSGTAELGLKNAITHRENVDDYGHLVYEALHKNKTSWVLYNMAAFYWRIKGNTYQAVECIRRALHHSPRLQKDVALISLANILHRARFCNEAAVLVHSALEVSKELNVNHFTLGNIYAVLGEYNKSIICFENTLKIQPDFEAAAKRRHAVLCHSKLELALEAQHRSLQRTLQDLKDYQRKHDLYQAQSDKLLSEQISHEIKIAQHIAYEQQRVRDQKEEKDEYCRMVDRNGKQVLLCKWGRRSPTLDLDFAFRDEEGTDSKARKEEKKLSGEKMDEKLKVYNGVDYSLPVKAPVYSKYKKHKPSESDIYTQESWPDKEECDNLVKQMPDPRNLTTVYLPPENKGFEVKELLTEAQGLTPGGQHPLPWYPPVCIPLLDMEEGNPAVYDHLKSVSYNERSRIPLKYNDPSMRKVLLSLVNGGSVTEEEVGQRILTALKKNIGPQWILYNLAGLYWRIVGNNFHGIECLRRAIHLCPRQYKDMPLVNLANILYRYGRYDDAIVIMRDALEISDVEPSTHFLMGHLLWATRNFTGAPHHYQEALSMEPTYHGALDSLRALKCYLKFHHAAQSAALQESPAMALGNNCQPKGKETENRVICKTENNEEKCIIETRTRNRLADCNGQCTQTCTISPIKLDGCSSDLNLENAITPGEYTLKVNDQTVGRCTLKVRDEQPAPQQPVGHCSGKGGKPFSSDQEDILFSGDFTSRLEDVSDHYEKKGVCHGDECGHLRVQSPLQHSSGPKPHTKLEYVEGILRHKLIFLQVSPSEMEVSPEDCVIFNDGTKSAGCSREEFQTYIQELEDDLEAMHKMAAEAAPHLPFEMYSAETITLIDDDDNDYDDDENDQSSFSSPSPQVRTRASFSSNNEKQLDDEEEIIEDEDADQELTIHFPPGLEEPDSETDTDTDKVVAAQDESVSSTPSPSPPTTNEKTKDKEDKIQSMGDSVSLTVSDRKDDRHADLRKRHFPPMVAAPRPVKFAANQVPENQISNTKIHLFKRMLPPRAELSDCNKPNENEDGEDEENVSSWLSLDKKGIDLYRWMDFPEVDGCPEYNPDDPICPEGLANPVMSMDHLPGVMNRVELTPMPESELNEVLLNLPGTRVSVCQIKSNLVDAMAKNTSSWLAYHLSGLYWRVAGNARHALDCLRVSISYAPYHYRDVPLIAMANVLQHSTYNNDAIVVTNAALHISQTQEVAHFTMAMLYAAKDDWDNTVLFLQACLAHSTTTANKERVIKKLRKLYCTDLASPGVYYLPKK